MQTTTIRSAQSPQATGEPTELGRYSTADGATRIIVGRRVEGTVHVFDVRAGQRDRGHEVDSGFASCQELADMVADYKRQAARLGQCPMSRAGIRAMLEAGPQ